MGGPPGPPEGGDRPLRGLPGGRGRPPGGKRPANDPPEGNGRPGRRPPGEERPLKVLPGGDRPLRVLHPDGEGPPLRVVTDGDGAPPEPEGGGDRRDGRDRRPRGKAGRRGRRPSRRRVLVAALVVGLLATIALAGRVGSGGPAPGRQPSGPGQATRPPPATAAPPSPVVATIGTGGFPYGMTFGAGSLWVAGGDHVTRIDPVSNRVEATIPFGTGGPGHAAVGPSGLAFGAGSVWAPLAVPGALWRIDPASNRVAARISLGGPLRETISVSATRGAVWVASRGEGEHGVLFRVDPARQRVVAEIPIDGVPTAVAASPAAAWVATAGGRVVVVDPTRNRVAGSVNTGGGPLLGFSQTIALGAGGVWLAEPLAEQVVRIDPADRRVVARIPAGAATNLAIGQGAVWVVSSRGLLRIDPGDDRVVAAVPAAELRLTLLVTTGGGAVWAAGWNSVARIDPARVTP
jgi:DNA-binding beta-propeller fold protein YncE